MKQFFSAEECSPFRRPDWRLERVLQMVDRPDSSVGRCTRRDDQYIKGLRNYIIRYRNADTEGRNKLAYTYPGIAWAYQIYEQRENEAKRMAVTMEARILAGMTDEQICLEMHTIPDTVKWYEKLFFDVRGRLQSLDWIMDHVLMPAYEQSMVEHDTAPGTYKISEPHYDCTLKSFAYFGGQHVLEHMLTGFRRGVQAHSRESVGQWLDSYYIDRLRSRSGMAIATFQLSKYDVAKLFELHNQLIAIVRNADSQEQTAGQMHTAVSAFLGDFKLTVGEDGHKAIADTPLGEYDNAAAELRESEMLAVAAGQKPGTFNSGSGK